MNRESFELYLSQAVPQLSQYQAPVVNAMRYSLLGRGKRVRPALMIAAYHLFKSDEAAVYPFAAALEMVHTYSLIHDDLPAMDDDDLRRGRPSCHIAHGEANAILAGDGLLNQAMETSLKASLEMDCKTGAQACLSLFTASGIHGMIGGQTADLLFEGMDAREEDLLFIHKKKTAALIRAALEIGGIVGKATPDELARLSKLGEVIGFAFQLQDDLLDRFSTEEALGKPIGSDEKNQKLTFLKVYGPDETQLRVENLFQEAQKIVNSFSNVTELQTLVNEILNRSS